MKYKEIKLDEISQFKKDELSQELAHEDAMFNHPNSSSQYGSFWVFIKGKKWKKTNNYNHAQSILRTLLKKGTTAHIEFITG
jgi:hypothetical protein